MSRKQWTECEVDGIIRDRDRWKLRALRAEELLESCRELTTQRSDELLKIKEKQQAKKI